MFDRSFTEDTLLLSSRERFVAPFLSMTSRSPRKFFFDQTQTVPYGHALPRFALAASPAAGATTSAATIEIRIIRFISLPSSVWVSRQRKPNAPQAR